MVLHRWGSEVLKNKKRVDKSQRRLNFYRKKDKADVSSVSPSSKRMRVRARRTFVSNSVSWINVNEVIEATPEFFVLTLGQEAGGSRQEIGG